MEANGEVEAAGAIATISEDLCVVSVNINGTDTAMSFGKKSLYTWGNQCEGDMTNILEEGMPVNVCYIQSGDVPSAIAVWIGEKPDLSNGDVEALVDVYDQKGTVDRILDDRSFTVRSDTACTVLVKVDALFRDGCSSRMIQQCITVGESVMFDAVPLEDGEDPSGAMYQATCAWVGKMPRLADRFGLHIADPPTQNLEVLTGDRVFGTVIVIPNEALAFVYVEGAHEKVMLLRSSFKEKFERIQDAVELGDKLCMRLRFSYIFSGCRQWFAEKACKFGEDVEHDTWMVQRARSSACVLPADDVISNSYDHDKKESVVSNENNEVLYGDPPLKGTFNFASKGKMKSLILYGKMKIAARFSCLYVGNGSKEDKVKILVPNSVVHFEAVLKYPQGKKYKKSVRVTHEALCVWIDRKPSLVEYAKHLTKASTCLLPSNLMFSGTVFNFYLPDTALVEVRCQSIEEFFKTITVCLHTSVLMSDTQRNKGRKDVIFDFVRLGDFLSCNVTQHPDCGDYFCAINVTLFSDKSPLNVASLRNGYSRKINRVYVSSPESGERSPSDDGSSNGMLCGNVALPDIICGTVRNYGDVNVTVQTSKAQTNQTNRPFSKYSKVLWSDPPLIGVCQYLSSDKPIIVHKNLKILFIPANFYIDGLRLGTVDDFMSLCKSLKSVRFEGTQVSLKALNKCGIFHRTDLVWVGEKPSFSIVAQSIGSVDKEMLAMPEKTFFGIVVKYYFPNMAVIKVKKDPVNSVVCLDTESFVAKPPCSSIKGQGCISDFVALRDKLEFKVKVKETCPLMLRAYNVRKLTILEYNAVTNHNNA